MMILPLKMLPQGAAYEYRGDRGCLMRWAMAELNLRLRPRWEDQQTRLRPPTLPGGWNRNVYGGGLNRPWMR